MPLQNVQITQVVNPMLGLTNIISGTYQALTNNYRQNPQSLGNDPASILQNSINFSMAHMFSNLPQIMGFTNQIAGFFMQNLVNRGLHGRAGWHPRQLQLAEQLRRCNRCAR